MARRRVATSKRRRPRLSGKVLRPRAESIFPGYASYRILLTTAPLKRCSNTNNRALAINLATRSNRATRFETKRANKTHDGRRSIDLRSINGQAINRSTNEIYTVSTWSVHLVGRDPCRGRRWSAPVSGIYLLLAGARALLPRLPFIPPLRPAGEFSTLTLLQARHDAILQAVPDQPGSIDILVFDSISIGVRVAARFSFQGRPTSGLPLFRFNHRFERIVRRDFFDFFTSWCHICDWIRINCKFGNCLFHSGWIN